VIGAGPAGIITAITVAENGFPVCLLDKNPEPAQKLLLTGQGRCNLTNYTDVEGLVTNIPGNGKFLKNCFHRFDAIDTIDFFHEIGLSTKVERGKRVFPESDSAAQVKDILLQQLVKSGVDYHQAEVTKVTRNNGNFRIETKRGKQFSSSKLIISTGGKSYPETGSDGSGYLLAEKLGHTIIPPRPSLVPIIVEEKWVKDLINLDLKNIAIRIYNEHNKCVYSDFGEMSFNSNGVGGPVILPVSAYLKSIANHYLLIDLKPALDEKKLDQRLLREFQNNPNKTYSNILKLLLPGKMIATLIRLTRIPGSRTVNQIKKHERKQIGFWIKNLRLNLKTFRRIEEALITSGGININEINPHTMASKLVPGLYFAGEIIDVDGLTGGFNLQVAWSTGRIAGIDCSLKS